jgi:hypothetical protein
MDIRRSVNTKFWSDAFIEELDAKEKLLFLYLLTNEKTNMLGIYEISVKRISYETGLTKEEIIKAFEGFERVRKAFFFDNVVFLPNWIKNQSMNTNMMKSARVEYDSFSNDLKNRLLAKGFKGFESLSKGCQTLPKKEEEKEKENEKENEKEEEEEKGNFLAHLENFLKTEKIENSECIEFLASESWFEAKSMQLKSEKDILSEKALEFLIALRDRDMIEGKTLIDLKSHFVSWFKKNPNGSTQQVKPNYLLPTLSEI